MESTTAEETQEAVNQIEYDISGARIVVDSISEFRETAKNEKQRENVDSVQPRVRFSSIVVDERENQLEQALPNRTNTRKKKIITIFIWVLIFVISIAVIIIFDHFTLN